MNQALLQAVAQRPNGPGRTVWLASYPKSGNTWMRAIITALDTHHHFFGVNHLGAGAQPHNVRQALTAFGIDHRWLSVDEIDRLRTALVERAARDPQNWEGPGPPPPLLRKTHEVFRTSDADNDPFPLVATRAAILIVRDPRDVACSYAPFFGIDLPNAVDALGRERHVRDSSPAHGMTSQPWGTWTTHAQSWLADDVPFPVHVVRYEDLKADAVSTLLTVFAAIGLYCTETALRTAVELSTFDRLQVSEAERGFRETSKATRAFFRRGRAGGWRTELPESQVADIEADHADMMQIFGYELTTPAHARRGLAEARASRRRTRGKPWTHLPPSLGLTVETGAVPQDIANAVRPRRFLQVNDSQALVTLGQGCRLLVEDGSRITVDWALDDSGDGSDPSWVVQGWGVTLAMLQRGELSLHAATVRIGSDVVAIAGASGAGKSTTSMGLRQRGHELLIDDVTLLRLVDGQALTTPYPRNVHLLPDAAAALGLDFDTLPVLAGGRTKAAFRAEDPPEESHRLDRIIVLTPSADAKQVTMRPVHGSHRASVLLRHADRRGLAPIILGRERFFQLVTQLANAVPVLELRRPTEQWTLDAVVDLISTVRD